jgi:hypothetical protein
MLPLFQGNTPLCGTDRGEDGAEPSKAMRGAGNSLVQGFEDTPTSFLLYPNRRLLSIIIIMVVQGTNDGIQGVQQGTLDPPPGADPSLDQSPKIIDINIPQHEGTAIMDLALRPGALMHGRWAGVGYLGKGQQ